MAYAGRWYHFRAMGVVRIRTLALFAATLLLVGACSREQDPVSPAATLGAAPSDVASAASEAASDSEPADPYAIPADPKDIDKEYVERVIEALNAGVVEATAAVASENKIGRAAKSALARTHLPEAQRGYFGVWREVLRGQSGAVQLDSNPTRVDIVEVEKIITATSTCIFTVVLQDSSGLVEGRVEPFPVYYHLSAKSPAAPNAGNPTPWMVAADSEPPPGGKEFADRCADS